MDMDLVVIFGFVLAVVIVAMGGFVLYPIARKLGTFLEHVGQERSANALAEKRAESLPASFDALPETMDRLEAEMRELTERQAFVERLLEPELGRRHGAAGERPANRPASGGRA